MPGPSLLVLLNTARPVAYSAPDFIGPVADHHKHFGRVQPLHLAEDEVQQGRSTDAVEDLGELGFHPLAQAGRQDDDCKSVVVHLLTPNYNWIAGTPPLNPPGSSPQSPLPV